MHCLFPSVHDRLVDNKQIDLTLHNWYLSHKITGIITSCA